MKIAAQKKTAIITHTDLDGVVCALLATMMFSKEEFENDVDVVFATHRNVDNIINDKIKHSCCDRMIITDICPQSPYTDADLDIWASRKGNVLTLFDHHQENPGNYDWVYWEQGSPSCASFMYFCSPPVSGVGVDASRLAASQHADCMKLGQRPWFLRQLVNLASARDSWNTASNYWKQGCAISSLIKSVGPKYVFMKMWEGLDMAGSTLSGKKQEADCVFDMLVDIGEVLNKIVNRRAKTTAMNPVTEFCVNHGQLGMFTLYVSDGDASEIAHHALEINHALDSVAVYSPALNVIQLRSRQGGVDVGAFAKTMGGGGHQAAAGFPAADEMKAALSGMALELLGMFHSKGK